MSEHLHDIDHLFKSQLEGHVESLPSMVWEGVSNDLDRQQALYYRNKYYRLKRNALLVLILLLISAGSILYYAMNSKQEIETGTAGSLVSTSSNGMSKRNALPNNSGTAGDSSQEVTATTQERNGSYVLPDSLHGAVTNNEKSPNEHNLKAYSNSAVDNYNNNYSTTPSSGSSTSKDEPRKLAYQNGHSVSRGSNTTAIGQSLTSSLTIQNAHSKKQFQQRFVTGQKSGTEIVGQPVTTYPTMGQPMAREQLSIQEVDLLIGNGDAERRLKALTMGNVQPINGRQLSTANNMAPVIKVKPLHELSLTAFVAPNISFDHLKDDDHLSGPGRDRNEAHKDEEPPTSFSGGLLLNYALSKKLSLQSGITFTTSSTTIAPQTVYAKAGNNGTVRYELHSSLGYSYISPKSGTQPAVGDSAKTSHINAKLSYISVPLAVSLRLQKGRFSLLPSIGVAVNILAGANNRTSLLGTSSSETVSTGITGLKRIYIDGRIGLGLEYGLSRKLSIGIRPTARLAFFPINKETPVKSYQDFLSLETGIRLKL